MYKLVELLCHIPETNITLCVNYTHIKKKSELEESASGYRLAKTKTTKVIDTILLTKNKALKRKQVITQRS